MIRYTLNCANGHRFESWFQSATGYDALREAGHVACAVCGSSDVEKSLMAPAVRPSRAVAESQPAARPLAAPASDVEAALAELRRQVEQNADYVGLNFAAEARRIHLGEAPERSIYGEAKPDDARRLIEDGVPVAPLPFIPPRKTN